MDGPHNIVSLVSILHKIGYTKYFKRNLVLPVFRCRCEDYCKD